MRALARRVVVWIFERLVAQKYVVTRSLPDPKELWQPQVSMPSSPEQAHIIRGSLPCGGASCLDSLPLVSALRLPSVVLVFSVDMCLRSGLLTLEVIVSRVVTVCFSVRRSRSSVDLMLFVRALPDSVLLCDGRSGPGAGEFAPDFDCVLDSYWVLVVLLSWVLMRGIRDDIFSPAKPLLFLLSA